MSRISQQVQNQITVSGKVIASARTHARKVAEVLAVQVPAPPPPAAQLTPAQWEAVVNGLADQLVADSDALRDRELAYTAEQADDGPVRAARDGKVAEVTALIVRLRSAVEDNLGREALRTYGLQGHTPRNPRTLLGYLRNVANLLRQTPATVTMPFGATFSTDAAATSLEAQHAALLALIQDDDREARELEEAMAQRDRALATWSDRYQGVAATLEGLYRLAGWRELADRIRPTQRAVRGEDSGPEMEPPAPEESAPEASGEPAAAAR